MARQEEGLRPASPLPYELYGDGNLSGKDAYFEISMKAGDSFFGEKSAGSPFIVYAPGEYLAHDAEKKEERRIESVRAWRYAVKVGDEWKGRWPMGDCKGEEQFMRMEW